MNWCRPICKGFYPGTCHRAFPMCATNSIINNNDGNQRRLPQEDDESTPAAAASDNNNNPIVVVIDESSRDVQRDLESSDTIMLDMMMDSHQEQRELVTGWCKENCRGFLPGTCQRAFPWCYGMRRRRQLEEEVDNNNADAATVVDLPIPPIEPQDINSLECVTIQRAVRDKLEELAHHTIVNDNEACVAALLGQYETQCFRVVKT